MSERWQTKESKSGHTYHSLFIAGKQYTVHAMYWDNHPTAIPWIELQKIGAMRVDGRRPNPIKSRVWCANEPAPSEDEMEKVARFMLWRAEVRHTPKSRKRVCHAAV